jgi:hypothetical protein
LYLYSEAERSVRYHSIKRNMVSKCIQPNDKETGTQELIYVIRYSINYWKYWFNENLKIVNSLTSLTFQVHASL